MNRSQSVDPGAAGGWAAAVPLLCAAHCMAAPLLVAAAPALAASEAMEPVVQLATLVFAAAMSVHGVRLHGRWAVFVPVAFVAVLWVAVAAAGLEGVTETAVAVVGSLAVGAGLWWNARLRHDATCRACTCSAHGG
jgi:hypothetical protein